MAVLGCLELSWAALVFVSVRVPYLCCNAKITLQQIPTSSEHFCGYVAQDGFLGLSLALLDRFGFLFLLACCIYVVVRNSHYNIKFPLLRNTFGATWLKTAFLGCLDFPWLGFFSASCCVYVVVRNSHYNKLNFPWNTFGATWLKMAFLGCFLGLSWALLDHFGLFSASMLYLCYSAKITLQQVPASSKHM